MKLICIIIFFSVTSFSAFSQKEIPDLVKGNKSYREQQYEKAAEAYEKVLIKAPGNSIANFNLGNALYRKNNPAEAEKMFNATIDNGEDKKIVSDAWYNKGVALTQQKKLEESIEAYKQTLRLNPADTLARENLVRALREQKKKQQQEQEEKKKKKDEPEKKKEEPKMTKQQVQQLLQALQEQEKKLQQKMQKVKIPSPSQPEKDW
jgi:Ca-activated chloride channel family protein